MRIKAAVSSWTYGSSMDNNMYADVTLKCFFDREYDTDICVDNVDMRIEFLSLESFEQFREQYVKGNGSLRWLSINIVPEPPQE